MSRLLQASFKNIPLQGSLEEWETVKETYKATSYGPRNTGKQVKSGDTDKSKP